MPFDPGNFIPEALSGEECIGLGTALDSTVKGLKDDMASLLSADPYKKLGKEALKKGAGLLTSLTEKALGELTDKILEEASPGLSILATFISLSAELEIAAHAYLCMQLKKNLQKELIVASRMLQAVNSLGNLLRQAVLAYDRKLPAEDPIIAKAQASYALVQKAIKKIEAAERQFNINTPASIRSSKAIWADALRVINRAKLALDVDDKMVLAISNILYEELGKGVDLGNDDDPFDPEKIKGTRIWERIEDTIKHSTPALRFLTLNTAIIENMKILVDLYPLPVISYLFDFNPQSLKKKKFSINAVRKAFPTKIKINQSGINTMQIKSSILVDGIKSHTEGWSIIKGYSDAIVDKVFTKNLSELEKIRESQKQALLRDEVTNKISSLPDLYAKRILWSGALSTIYKVHTNKAISKQFDAITASAARKGALKELVTYLETDYVNNPYSKVGSNLVLGLPTVMAGVVNKGSAEAAQASAGFIGNTRIILSRGMTQTNKTIRMINAIDIENMEAYPLYVKMLRDFAAMGPPMDAIIKGLTTDLGGVIDSFANKAANLTAMVGTIVDIANCAKKAKSTKNTDGDRATIASGIAPPEVPIKNIAETVVIKKVTSIQNTSKKFEVPLSEGRVNEELDIGDIFKTF